MTSIRIHERLVGLSRRTKQLIMIVADGVVLPCLVIASLAIRLGLTGAIPVDLWLLPAAPAIIIPLLWFTRVYHGMVRQSGVELVRGIFISVTLASMALTTLAYMVPAEFAPRSMFIIFALLAMIYLSGSRWLVRRWLSRALGGAIHREPVAIYGAGEAGIQAATALKSSGEYRPVLFVDDNPSLHGTVIGGLRVLSREQLATRLQGGDISTILLALPSASRSTRMEVVQYLEQYAVAVKSVPPLQDIIAGRARVEALQDVAIEDLLGRQAVEPDQALLELAIAGKTVLVTGAGGSIGSELCRQIVGLAPARLVLLEVSEFSLYTMEQELGARCREAGVELVCRLGSVTDPSVVGALFQAFGVDTVFHAAAYKHVPIVEENECAGWYNNVVGTRMVAEAAEQAGTERFILVSTDKAVRPTNVMGATKRLSEMVLQALADRGSKTLFSMVRFGNVLGSSGSVVPLFRRQIREGGPVTVTHPEVTRYFMTIPEAAQLVIQAGAMAKGGEVFLLDMGEPVRIVDLARTMIHLMGQSVRDEAHPDGDIEIQVTGLRPGEKLYEELLIGDDSVGTAHPSIMQAQEDLLAWDQLAPRLEAMATAAGRGDAGAVRDGLSELVDGYRPAQQS